MLRCARNDDLILPESALSLAAMNDFDDSGIPYWRQRPRPIGREFAYRLRDGDMLEIEASGKIDRVPLSTVEQMRFFFAPSNISASGFRTTLRLGDGRTITFGNLSWRSFTDIDRDDAGYRRFVAALSAAVARTNPKARFVAGRPYSLWLAAATVGGLAIAMLAYVTIRSVMLGETTTALLGLVLVAASIWQVRPMILLNRPRELRTGEVPDDLVPGG